jgi:hypothetical protein
MGGRHLRERLGRSPDCGDAVVIMHATRKRRLNIR